jgi:peptidoglycan/xylan/chitin deacetylase (PgdA/CDA1 family)
MQFTAEAKAEFASVADGWVIAYAKANDLVVVTHEEYAPDAKRKVPIPHVCLEFDVEYCNTYEMLKGLKERFVLKHRRTR